MDNFWDSYEIPIQEDFLELGIEEINPAEAYRRQAYAVNMSGPVYAELEIVKAQLTRVETVEEELRSRILAQNMPVKSSSTRTNELIEGFLLDCAKEFEMPNGEVRDVSDNLVKLKRRRKRLSSRIEKLENRIYALNAMAEKCDRILNWAKFEARMEKEGL